MSDRLAWGDGPGKSSELNACRAGLCPAALSLVARPACMHHTALWCKNSALGLLPHTCAPRPATPRCSFDYRLGMGLPDYWIKLLKHVRGRACPAQPPWRLVPSFSCCEGRGALDWCGRRSTVVPVEH